ncbi:MAG: rRNA pseudouridine synthase [Rickettsiales bacterium]|nr:rRNA pseudouridine synthase [Rickettsiales bacterium]
MQSMGLTRKAASKIISEKRISINLELSTSYSAILNEKDEVRIDDKIISLQTKKVYLFHKPQNVIVSSKHDDDRQIIYDLIPENLHHLKYVGRLDANSEGLLLLTNDASYKNYIENPKNNIEKIYKVRCFGIISKNDLAKLKKPINVDEIIYNFRQIKLIKSGSNSWYQIILTEGKNREIRKVFEHLGHPVSRIIRLSVDKFQLGNLKAGELKQVI